MNILSLLFPSISSEYFFDYFKDYFANLGPSEVPAPEILQAAVLSGYPVPEVARRIRVRPSADALTGADGVKRRLATIEGIERPKVIAPFDGPQSTDALRAQQLSESKPIERLPGQRKRPARFVASPRLSMVELCVLIRWCNPRFVYSIFIQV